MTATPLPATASTRPATADPGTLVHERDTGRVLRWTGREWVDDLPGWLLARYVEAEQEAREAVEMGVGWYGLANQEPRWRLADIARKRAILADHSVIDGWDGENLDGRICERCCSEDLSGGREGEPYPCWTVRVLAAEFAGAPGWSDAWRAE